MHTGLPTDARVVEARAVGFVGSVVVAVAALTAGALPVAGSPIALPLVRALDQVPPYTMGLAYFGLALLVGAWWRLGSIVRQARVSPREMTITLVWWSAPLALSAPLYSRDVYSYLAQGAMVVNGIDAYEFGPAALGGHLAAQVSPIWQHTPAPYGPAFLLVAGGVMAVAGESVVAGIVGMRIVALASLAAMVWAVPAVARRHGVDPARALWLGVLNPLVIAHVVSGVHNEALMVALLLVAVLLTLAGRPLLASAVVGVAFLVKAPAIVALAFIVAAVWGQRRLRPLPLTALSARVGGVAAATVVAITLVTGIGFGWVQALGNTAELRNVLSMTTSIGVVINELLRLLGVSSAVDVVGILRLVGLLGAAAVAAYALLRRRDRPFLGLAVTLVALVVLGPVVNPWYLLWGLPLLAATTAHHRIVRWVAVVSVVLTFYPEPAGGGPTMAALAGAVGIVAGAVFLPLSRPLSAPLVSRGLGVRRPVSRDEALPAPGDRVLAAADDAARRPVDARS